jgi:hypothetical protein
MKPMNIAEISKKTRSVAAILLQERGYIAPVEVLVKMEVISPMAYEDWRMGRVPYLERVTACGLGKLNTILKTLSALAAEQGLKPSLSVYKKWGKGKIIRLRFSKTGSPHMENKYATHYCQPAPK